jgi:nucleoside-diphosphate-sugar epimerase
MTKPDFWNQRRTLVTGGASFIGSHLVDRLVELGARVRVVDNLSVGRLANLGAHVSLDRVEFELADLRETGAAKRAVDGIEVVFHLAADHGGRGYIATHPVECSTNMILDGVVFDACRTAGVHKVVYASSGCVYPTSRQMLVGAPTLLSEDMVGPPFESDDLYGWAKLMGEFTLRAYYEQHGMKSACCRLFTVYGPRCGESHAVMAMIGRAFVQQNPFTIWGTGEQVRNWTFVDDIVHGLLLAAEMIDDGSAVNLGTSESVSVRECATAAMELAEYRAPIRTLPDMPTGVLSRVADTTLAHQLLGWTPETVFRDGLRRTFEWYASTKDRDDVSRLVGDEQALLTHRIGDSIEGTR